MAPLSLPSKSNLRDHGGRFPERWMRRLFPSYLRSQTSRDKLAQLFDNQFRQMAMLIDQQIRLLQTRYPNEHLVSTRWLSG